MKTIKGMSCYRIGMMFFFILLAFIGHAQNDKDSMHMTVIIDRLGPPPPDSMHVYTVVQVSPKLLNGDINKYFNGNPIDAKVKQESGRVFVSFIVERDGMVSNIRVLRTTDTTLNKQAIQIVTASKWIPGQQNEKTVRTQLIRAINFKVQVSSADSTMKH